MIGRREVISLIGGAVAWPVVARAQQPALPMIGFLGTSSPGLFVSRVAAFHDGSWRYSRRLVRKVKLFGARQ